VTTGTGGTPEGDREGAVATVFRSRLRVGVEARYQPVADALEARARTTEGFVDFASVAAPDGERVSITVFADRAAHDRWRDDAEHRRVQALGRREFYEEFSIQVCRQVAGRHFTRGD
jgi:heme-degrading monooxygenase HmoA